MMSALLYLVKFLVSLVLASVVSVAAMSAALACSQIPPLDFFESLDEPLLGVPVEGVLVVSGYVEVSPDVTWEVRDGDDNIVPGTLESAPGRIVWRSDEPLVADAQYQVTAAHVWTDTTEFSFITRADAWVSVPVVSVDRTVMNTEVESTRQVCCDDELDSCGGTFYLDCWHLEHQTRVTMSIEFSAGDVDSRYYTGAVSTTAPFSWVHAQVGGDSDFRAFASFSDLLPPYCQTVGIKSLVDGAVTETEVCDDGSTIEFPLLPLPETPDPEQCEGPLVDPETGETVEEEELPEVPGEKSGGCTVGTLAPSSSAASWLLLFLGVGFVRRRYQGALRRK
jgi:hypothetical protein